MKKIFIIQSVPGDIDLIKKQIETSFVYSKEMVNYCNNFESTLELIPEDGGITVITSYIFHDKEDILFAHNEKNGDKLAEEIKKINPKAKVYVYSTNESDGKFIDGFFKKGNYGYNVEAEIIELFYLLDLASRPIKRQSRFSGRFNTNWGMGTGNYCPDCGGLCGNDKHTRRW